MQCREAVFSEDVLEYFVGNYRGEQYVQEVYNPDCYIPIDNWQGVIYQKVQNVNSEVIQRYGFSAIPNVYGLMDEEALEASGVLRIRRQPYLDIYGQGVLIGFVDTGIDYTHEAFISADGTSRIVSIWDQTVEDGVGTKTFPYGRVYSQEQLNQALSSDNPFELVPTQDEVGHGTFLAGVAAGNENRSRGISGVAPLSRIVMVKCKQAKQSYRDYYGIPRDVPAFQENDIMAESPIYSAWQNRRCSRLSSVWGWEPVWAITMEVRIWAASLTDIYHFPALGLLLVQATRGTQGIII